MTINGSPYTLPDEIGGRQEPIPRNSEKIGVSDHRYMVANIWDELA